MSRGEGFLRQYVEEVKQGLDSLDFRQLERIRNILLAAYERGATIFALGNGGSATTASHFACDLAKGTISGGSKKRFRVVSLVDSTSLLTAWGNDEEYSQVFREQLVNLLQPGDVVVAFSTSGNSPNVLRAIEYAREVEAITVGFTGFQGGKLHKLVELGMVVPLDSVTKVEDIHILLQHALCVWLRKEQLTKSTAQG